MRKLIKILDTDKEVCYGENPKGEVMSIKEDFTTLLKDFIRMFAMDGPFVAERNKVDGKTLSEVMDLYATIESLTPEDKAYIFHGIMFFLLMLMFDYDKKYDDREMPTANIFADAIIGNFEKVCKENLNLTIEQAIIYSMYYPMTKRKEGTNPIGEVLMTMDCANRMEGD
jgi:hypothetical protein